MVRRIIGALLGVALALASVQVLPAASATAATAADFADARARYVETFTGGTDYSTTDPGVVVRTSALSADAQTHWDSLDKTSGRTYLWYDIRNTAPGAGSEYIQTNYQRILTLVLALKTRGTTLYGNTALQADIIAALDWMHQNWYNPTVPKLANWYPWEIGGPTALNTATLLMYADLTAQQRADYMAAVAHFAPTITHAGGANRAWAARVFIGRGLVSEDESVLLTGRNAIPVLFDYQTTVGQDGFFEDGSYLGHQYWAYTAGYGLGYFDVVSSAVYWLEGTPWEITDASKANLAKWAIDGFIPVIHKGVILPSVTGRNMSRVRDEDHVSGVASVVALLRVASISDASSAQTIREAIKYWLENSVPADEFYRYASIFSIVQARELLQDTTVPATPVSLYKQYPLMDRAVVQRPDYSFSVSMHSNRTKTYESINGENLRGWYQGDGATTLYAGDGLDQYSDHYWPTVNSYRLPGTTVLLGATKASQSNASTLAGGVELKGTYGTSAMTLGPATGTTLSGNKSWFMFDDEVVALGSNWSSNDNKVVETIVDNRKLESTSTTITRNGSTMPTGTFSGTYAGTQWVNFGSTAADAGIGYYFPGQANLQIMRESRTGTWSDINQLAPFNDTTSRSNTFANMRFNHGTNPDKAKYAYIVLPNHTAAETSAYAAAPDIHVLAHTDTVHAAKDNTLNMIGANFFATTGGSVSVGPNYPNFISANKRASVMTQQKPASMDVAVADPTFGAGGVIRVTLAVASSGTVSADPGVTVVQSSPTTIIDVDVTGSRGATREVTLSF